MQGRKVRLIGSQRCLPFGTKIGGGWCTWPPRLACAGGLPLPHPGPADDRASLCIEVFAFGLRAGWEVLFEPPLGSGRYADIRLVSGSMHLLVEATMMRMSVEERKALAEDRRLSWQLQSLEWQYDVRYSLPSG